MSKFSYNISSITDQKGESQIMIRVYVSREQRFRVKSGIYVDSKRWGKKNEINIRWLIHRNAKNFLKNAPN